MSGWQSGFKTYKSLPLIKTDDESFEERDASDQVEPYPEIIRESYEAGDAMRLKLQLDGMQVHRNKSPIPDLDVDPLPLLPVKANGKSKARLKYTVKGARVYIRFHTLPSALIAQP